MRRNGRSLDDQIAEVEERLSRHRAELRYLAAEARSRINASKAVPLAVVAALAIGFAASRFVRKPAKPEPVQRGSRPTRLLGAVAAAMLPPLIRPLQHAIAEWLAQRMHRASVH